MMIRHRKRRKKENDREEQGSGSNFNNHQNFTVTGAVTVCGRWLLDV